MAGSQELHCSPLGMSVSEGTQGVLLLPMACAPFHFMVQLVKPGCSSLSETSSIRSTIYLNLRFKFLLDEFKLNLTSIRWSEN